jgi:hypothetical protein
VLRREASLFDEFLRLESETDRARRGRSLEPLVARLFKRSHFEVTLGAGAARPRQTDLIARGGRDTYVIETKWRDAPSDVGDVDGLRSRLQRLPGSPVGVLISISGFASSVIEEIERDRRSAVLLIDGEELRSLLANTLDLRRLLKRKHESLAIHGKVLVTDASAAGSTAPLGQLPTADAWFVDLEGQRLPWLAAPGGFGGFTFVREVPDIDWVAGGGAGAALDLPLQAETVDELLAVIGELSDIGWATPQASWCLQQAETTWHGFGAESLRDAMRQRDVRYAGAGRIHHTEQLAFHDACEGGFYTVSAGVDARDHQTVWEADMSVQLVGVPLDSDPYQQLADRLHVQRALYFRPRTEPSVRNAVLPGFYERDVEPIAYVVSRRQDDGTLWTCGFATANPYMNESLGIDEPGAPLRDTEVLICSLSAWHYFGEPDQRYYLRRYSEAFTSHAAAVHVSANWR